MRPTQRYEVIFGIEHGVDEIVKEVDFLKVGVEFEEELDCYFPCYEQTGAFDGEDQSDVEREMEERPELLAEGSEVGGGFGEVVEVELVEKVL